MNKKLTIFLIFIVLLVGISFVSAENIDDMGDLSTNDVDNVISTDLGDNDGVDESDALSSNADNSFDDLGVDESNMLSNPRSSTTVNNWTELGREVYYNNYDTIYLGANITPGNQISIRHSVTIIGSADTYIGGSSSNSPVSYSNIPIYSSASGLSITLKNIRFQNCGGNILMKFSGNGNYILDNCTFENVTATGDHQSVVHLNLGNCEIINCTFEKCTTSYGTVSNYNENSVTNVHMTVRDSTFKNNHATVEPGCINNCGQLEVYDSVFEDNSATWWAGAIHTHTNANTTVVRSIFRNNIAGWNGGALYTYSHLTVIDSIFTGNEAHQTSGGAIAGSGYGSRPYLTVLNSEFRNNTASGSGGAISFGSSELIVNNSVFDNNKALSGTGGAISTSGATSTITYSNFTNNSATGRGGAIYATGNGQLNVYHCNFVNNTGSEGQDIAYHYTTKKTNKAFLRYDYNEFWGANNASGSIYAYNRQYLNVTDGSNNGFHDISQYVTPSGQNSTNNTNGTIIVPDSFNGNQLWNASLSGALGGTPLVNGDVIYVPNGNSIYCLNITNGNLLWNVSSNFYYSPEWNNFHDLGLHNGVLIAPCDMDKLYFFNATTGSEIQPTSNIIQGSSLYAPLIVGDTIYISSEYGYGANNESWIAVIEYNNGVYSYAGSILNISGISYGTPALISAPIFWNNYLWVNTVNGLMRVDLATNTSNIVLANTVGKPVVGGNNIYVLTNDNHVCAIGANGNIAMNILVNGSVGVGSTLVSNAAGNMVFTVCEDGSVYMVLYYVQEVIPVYKVNQVSSALSIGTNNILYVGDDAGILWAFRVIKMGNIWKTQLLWAFDASSTIHGTPVISGNNIYIGTEDMFYAVSGSSNANNLLNINNELSNSHESKSTENDLLGLSNDEILGEYNELHVNHENFNQEIFRQSNTIFYIDEGVYEVKDFYIGGYTDFDYDTFEDKIYSYENIIVRPNGDAKVTIKIVKSEYDASSFNVLCGKNITIENLKFTSERHYSLDGVINICNAENVMFNNCTFENITNDQNQQYPSIIQIMDGTLYAWDADNYKTKNPVINNCKFINCKAMYIIVDTHAQMHSGEDLGLINISNCIFENSEGTFDGSSLSLLYDANVYLENNTFDSVSPITITAGKIISEVSFKFLTKTLTNNTPNDIEAELVDSNGNHIYASNLKFSVNGGEEQKPTYKNGIYTLSYTPHENKVNVIASCSNVNCLFEEKEFSVVVSPELTINSTDVITYGDSVIDVNATLKDDINGENVTFTLLKDGTVMGSVNATITNGFANATFNQKLNVGSYTLSVTYGGSDNYGSATASKSLTVSKATPNFIITVNEVFTVKDNITVTVSVPEGCEGTMFVGIFRGPGSRVDGKYDIPVTSGNILNFTFNPLAANDYLIKYSFVSPSNSNFNSFDYVNGLEPSGGLPKFKVVKLDSNPVIDVEDVCLGDNVSISVSGLNESVTGNITITIDDLDPVTIDVKETYNISSLGAGVHTVKVVYSGDDTFSGNETTDSFNVFTIALEKYDVDYNSDVVAILPAGAEGMLGIEIDGKEPIEAPVVNGSATFKLVDFKPGNYTLNMYYQGSPITLHAVVNITVIPKITPVEDLNTVDNTIALDLPSDANGNLTITIDGNTTIVVPVENGTAAYSLENLTAGEHNITVAYEGNYPAYTSTQSVNVAKGTPEGKVNAPASITAGSAVIVPITLPGDASGIVLVDVDGKKYYAEVVNGTANVDIAGLTAGDKVLTYKYLGDDKYLGFTANVTLKVTAPASTPAKTPVKAADKVTLTLKKVTVKKSAKKVVLQATLKINGKAKKGLKVTFKFNGKKYTGKTNAKGIAKVTVKKSVLKKLKAGKKVKYQVTYGKKTVKKTVKVKK